MMATTPTPAIRTATGTARDRASSPIQSVDPFTAADWTLFLAISFIWGSSFLLIAMGLDGLTSGMVTFLRVGSGALTLWLVRLGRLLARRSRGASKRAAVNGRPTSIDRGDWPMVVLLSVIWVAIPFTLFPMAQQHINSAVTGLLNGATPVFVAVVSVLLTRTLPAQRQVTGIAIGLVGLVLLSLPSINDGESQALGVAMVLAATVGYGFSINLSAPLQVRYGAITLMSWVLGLATVWLIPVGLWEVDQNEWIAEALIPVLVLGVIGTGLAYWIMSTLVGRVGSIRASLITYLIPVVSLVLGVVVRDDQVAPLALIGAVLVTIGALLASRRST